MSIPSSRSLFARLAALAPVAALFAASSSVALAALDHSVTERIWKIKHGVTDTQMYAGGVIANGPNTGWLAQDSDGDGISNKDESAAGTDPFNAAKTLGVKRIAQAGGNAELQFPTESGKRYRIESTTSLTDPGSWTLQPQPTPVQVVGDGSLKTLSVPYVENSFYRVRVDDLDSDGDNVSDWAELVVTLNPNVKTTVTGVNDHDYVTEQLALPSLVTIKASKPFASEDGPEAGVLTVLRTQTLFPITVSYNIDGTAIPGVDYHSDPLTGVAALGRGIDSFDIPVNPVAQPSVRGGRSVTATLTAPSGNGAFALGAAKSATVIINDSVAPTGTGLLARYYDHANATYAHAANFGDAGTYVYVRTSTGTPNTGTITIPYTKSPAVQLGHVVRCTFTGGNLNNALYNNLDYTVTAVNPGVNFTLAINGAALPANSNSSCNFSIQSFPHPAVVERVDPTVDFDWMRGTPNGNVITVGTVQANPPDNYSTYWEGYLHPTTAGSYQFQLDADDKARVLLDLNDGNGLQQILEHGWDGPATIGTFKQSAAYNLVVPPSEAQRYRIRVEHVETTGEARCRLQWRAGTAAFANILQANVFTHTAAMSANYSFTRTSTTAGAMTGTITVTLNGHGLAVNDPVALAFSSGVLFTPANGNFHGNYTVSSVTNANVFAVQITAPSLPASATNTGAGFVLNRPTSTTTGWFNEIYANTSFAAPPGRVGVDASGATTADNGIYGTGTPFVNLINPDTFSIRWTGQVQPQFSEEYTFVVHADDGCRMWINGQEQEFRMSVSTNVSGPTYTYDTASGVAVINYAGAIIEPNRFAVGDIIRVDPTAGTLTTFATTDLLVTAATPTTVTVTFPTGFGDQTAAATANIDILNSKLKTWASNGNERHVRIPMLGGVRYDIRLDYWENTTFSRCRLFWYSASQPKQIIPANRLYPSNGDLAPATVISPTEATALVGGVFKYPILGSNGAVVTVSGNPAWLNFENGVLQGVPPAGSQGDYQVVVTLTSSAGTATSVLNLHVAATGGTVVRETWTGIGGTSVASIPVNNPPNSTANLSALQFGGTGTNYGTRIRGRLTAPLTGNYYFWVAASDGAELWISNDGEPVNAVKRAWVSPGTAPGSWSGNGQPAQKSPWLALEAGQDYYFEILHKAGGSGGDHLAVGWLKPGESGDAPSEIVPGYVLSPWSELVALDPGATVYAATLRPQGAVLTSASGSTFLRLNSAETEATLTIKYNDLSSAYFGMHVHNEMIPGGGLANVVCDLDEPGDVTRLPDGSYRWVIQGVSNRTREQIVSDLKNGKLFFNVHSTNFPGGEIKGHYSKVDGSQTFTPPPPPPTWADDHATEVGAVRFLTQATFGANVADVAALKAMPGYEAWIDDQFTKPVSYQLPEVMRTENASAQGGAFDEALSFNAWWRNSVSGPDQLRQRIAFALSQIHVVSAAGPLDNNARALSYFYDLLAENAFGNFRDILEATTLTPTMGRYLDMLRNDKPDLAIGRIPNENYAREIKQLFAVGLFRMWPDGTLVLNSQYEPIETYTQREIVGFAHAFTGWDYGYDGAFRTALNAGADWTRQMREVPARHFTGPKRILNNEVLPGLPVLGGQPLDPFAVHNSMQFNNAAYQALPAQELAATHDQLFNHPNVGPFICRQLIQRLVTSHPSRGYLYRVVQKFNNNGAGVRGDMKAVIKAILLDYEARHPGLVADPTFGKQREPVMRVAAVGRAFRPQTFTGTYVQNGTRAITVTTTTPHLLSSANNVFLEFDTNNPADPANSTSDPAPWIGTYSATTPLTSNTFTVNAIGWVTGTYSIPANSATCTVTMSNHWLQNGHKVFVDFTSGAADGVAGLDGAVYTLTSASPETGTNGTFTFQITTGTSASARTGAMMLPRFSPGSYTTAASGLPAPNDRRVTMDTNSDHHLQPGDQVQLNFFGGNPTPVDMVVTVENVVDLNTWTFLAPAAGTNLGTNQGNNSVYQFPLLSQPLFRKGVVGSRPSTFAMGSTDAVIDQSPLNSPTVFNFYLPDYKFPGMLAALGLTTPEFQQTAETSVIRQANFLLDGVLNPTSTTGLSSFRTGSNALVMDYSAWMSGTTSADLGLGAPATPAKPWTNNENIDRLIDQLSTLLTANQLSAEAKTVIRNFVALPITSIGTGNPCTVTTAAPHGLKTGDVVLISGVNGGTFSSSLNNTTTTRIVTVTGPTDGTSTTFTIPISCTAAPNAAALSTAHVSVIPYNNGVVATAPSTATHKRDRLRTIIHLILTSPDYTIQR